MGSLMSVRMAMMGVAGVAGVTRMAVMAVVAMVPTGMMTVVTILSMIIAGTSDMTTGIHSDFAMIIIVFSCHCCSMARWASENYTLV